MSNKDQYTYGSVDAAAATTKSVKQSDAEKGGDDDGFKETDLLYVRPQNRSLSSHEKRVRFLKIAVPIIVAVILIGGLAMFLLRGFTLLYPGPDGSSTSSTSNSYSAPQPHPAHVSTSSSSSPKSNIPSPTSNDEFSTPVSAPRMPPTTSSSTKSSSSGGSTSSSSSPSCSDNPKCSALGLTGQCCPTTSGDMLDCCS